jgi:hypothetical protein
MIDVKGNSTPLTVDAVDRRLQDAYRAAYDEYEDVARYLEHLTSMAYRPLALAELYAKDHPDSEFAPEAIRAALEIVDFLRFLGERMYGFRRFMALQALADAWPERDQRETAW